ncbi:hypothetical protein LguiA_023015 [Lonicera macranthoides]
MGHRGHRHEGTKNKEQIRALVNPWGEFHYKIRYGMSFDYGSWPRTDMELFQLQSRIRSRGANEVADAIAKIANQKNSMLQEPPGESTNTFGLLITRLNISNGANLKLLDGKDNVIWQYFDYLTDTWLPNQSISSVKGLTSSISSSNLGTALYSLTVGIDPYTILAFINSDGSPTKLYVSRLRPDTFGWTVTAALKHSQTMQPCGSYGVCSDGNSSYLKQSLDWQPTIGCTPITPSSCNDKHLHSFLELKKVTYFHLKPLHSTKDKESYKRACLDNCTCKAAFFSWQLFFTITTLLVEIRH